MCEYADIDNVVVTVSADAVGVEEPGTVQVLWIPRSVIEDGEYVGVGDDVCVAEWYALQEGFI